MPRRKAATPPVPVIEKEKAQKVTRRKAVKNSAEKPAETAAADGFSMGLSMLFGGRLEAAENAGKNQKAAQSEPQETAKPTKTRRAKAKVMPKTVEAVAAEQPKKRRTRKQAEPIVVNAAVEQTKKRGGRKKAEPVVAAVAEQPKKRGGRKKAEPVVEAVAEQPKKRGGRKKAEPVVVAKAVTEPPKKRQARKKAEVVAAEVKVEQPKKRGGRKKAEPVVEAVVEQTKKRGGRKKAEPIVEAVAEPPKKRGGRKKAEPIVAKAAAEQPKRTRKAKVEIAANANTPVDLKDTAYINSVVEKLKIALAAQMVDIKFIFKRARIVIGLESKEDLERIVKLLDDAHEKDVAEKTARLRSASLRFSK